MFETEGLRIGTSDTLTVVHVSRVTGTLLHLKKDQNILRRCSHGSGKKMSLRIRKRPSSRIRVRHTVQLVK